MTKELTPLEAYNELYKAIWGNIVISRGDVKRDCKIIETTLKEYETLKREYDFLGEHYRELLKETNQISNVEPKGKGIVAEFKGYEIDFDKIKKQDEILRIIKEKEVDVGWLKRAKNLYEYNSGMGINSYSALTHKEYDLLKEYFK